ncbi:MAG: hypothetical protein JNL67_03280 [Planctomycetaceae bacterium]|nr:hypothetical protein [Planctomycetaceae bacterium]
MISVVVFFHQPLLLSALPAFSDRDTNQIGGSRLPARVVSAHSRLWFLEGMLQSFALNASVVPVVMNPGSAERA